MLRYLLRRLANYAVLLFIATSLAYVLASKSMDPTQAFDWSNPKLDHAAVYRQLDSYNIDPRVSVFTRYGHWLKMVFGHWDWGMSPKGDNVNSMLATYIPVSLRLVILGTLLGMLGGVAVGAWTAVHQYGWADRTISVLSLLVISTPTLVIAVVLQMLATSFNNHTGTTFFQFIGESGTPGNYPGAMLVDRLQHLLLPTLSLTLGGIAIYSRYQRNLMLDTLGADYVRTARAKGLRKGRAIRHHALRNAIIPMATYFAFAVAQVFVGAAITETVFGWHGIGAYSVASINAQDINGTAAVAAFSGLCVLAGALLSDLLIAAIDPRVRRS